MQVRGLLHGQGWFDLRQHRLNPPLGASIHWSRLVDLPIAGLILGLRPFLGGSRRGTLGGRDRADASLTAPDVFARADVAAPARASAYLLAFLALFFAASTNGMFQPERIDHHGWQLALLALGIAGIADPDRTRGGLTLGISTALSLVIGLEMIIYLALGGVAMVLFWVDDPDERERLRAYAVSLAAARRLVSLFASNDNRTRFATRCRRCGCQTRLSAAR